MEIIDVVDRRILKILQTNGRISNLELSELVSLSPSACHRRLKKLIKNGLISSFCALIDPKGVELKSTILQKIPLIILSETTLIYPDNKKTDYVLRHGQCSCKKCFDKTRICDMMYQNCCMTRKNIN